MRITHGRISLELHTLARRDGPTLLLLHALFGSSDDWGAADDAPAVWPGSVYALDFSGHGRSDRLTGGSYYPELLAADVDVALAHIGPARIAGAGLGAYVTLLVAGARPDLVPAALLLPGAGLEGGGALPDFEREFPDVDAWVQEAGAGGRCDPLVRTLDLMVRPPDYAEAFARAARRLLLVENGTPRPPWWEAAGRSPSAQRFELSVGDAFARLANAA
jgi:pimeloyl-ACP methyl ester carboxylesterase